MHFVLETVLNRRLVYWQAHKSLISTESQWTNDLLKCSWIVGLAYYIIYIETRCFDKLGKKRMVSVIINPSSTVKPDKLTYPQKIAYS